jgi:hypothetical protein
MSNIYQMLLIGLTANPKLNHEYLEPNSSNLHEEHLMVVEVPH